MTAKPFEGDFISEIKQIDSLMMSASREGKHIVTQNSRKAWKYWFIPRETDSPVPRNSAPLIRESMTMTLADALDIMKTQTFILAFNNVTLFHPIIPPGDAPIQTYFLFRLYRNMIYVGTQDQNAYKYTLPQSTSDRLQPAINALWLDYYRL